MHSSTLHIIAYKDFKFKRIGVFPEGRWLSRGGRTLVMSKDLPLGRFLQVGCEHFGTIAQNAQRTRYFAPRQDGFVEVSSDQAELYRAEIRRKETLLSHLKSELQKNAGEYLGLALSLYYDYAALGEARAGWARQNDYFAVPGYAGPSAKACFETMRADLRARLSIPKDWP
jgi:hypothetical protein